jgi:hypothetical protein
VAFNRILQSVRLFARCIHHPVLGTQTRGTGPLFPGFAKKLCEHAAILVSDCLADVQVYLYARSASLLRRDFCLPVRSND